MHEHGRVCNMSVRIVCLLMHVMSSTLALTPACACVHFLMQVAYHGRIMLKAQPQLSFLHGTLKLPDGSSHGQSLSLDNVSWIATASAEDLSWLHFALYKHHHIQK